MASILRVNTLTDASSNNSIAMSFVAEGSAKAWYNFDGSASSLSARDSLNSSSLTDNATGNYSNNLASNMGNVNYSYSFGSGTHSDSRFFHQTCVDVDESGSGNAPTTSVFRMQNIVNGGATSASLDHDHDFIAGSIHGDLA